MSESSVTVFVAQGEAEAQQVRGFLEAHGIPAAVRGEALRMTHAFTLDGLGRVEIQVPAAHEADARDLLARAERGELRLADDDLRSDS